MAVLDVIWHGLRDAFLMGWQVLWALAFGFVISGVVQAWVSRARVEAALSGDGVGPIALATGLGAASSSCSYAAVAIAKSLFQKGASASSALAFQFASTNLVWELGLVLWVLIGWPFAVGEYVGGIVMIGLMAVGLRLFVSRRTEAAARAHAERADTGHQHHMAGEAMSWRARLTSASAWSDVAHNVRGDLQMLWKEIAIGFLLAGFVAQFGNGFFHAVFLSGAPSGVRTPWDALVGPLIAMASFVCSVGNVPLAAVLWSGGIGFAGVMAFIFADLIILPILAIYRKYYGWSFALRITALMFTAMVLAALLVDLVFGGLGWIPSGPRPGRAHVFPALAADHTLVLNVLALALVAVLWGLTVRRGAVDPMCGMTVDRAKARREGDVYFCSEHCRQAYLARENGSGEGGPPVPLHGGVGRPGSAAHPDVTRVFSDTSEIDPVCGMAVNPEFAESADHQGVTYFFCCEGCEGRFRADPAGTLAAAARGR